MHRISDNIIWIFYLVMANSYLMNRLSECERSDIFGPYATVLREIEKCSEDIVSNNGVDFTQLKVKKISRDQMAIYGNFTLHIPYTNEMHVIIDAGKYGNGGFKPHLIQVDAGDPCSSGLKFLTDTMRQIMSKNNLTKCSFPPGVYEFVDVPFPRDFGDLPEFEYGRYKVEMQITRDTDVLGCIVFAYDVVPKKNTKKVKENI